MKQSEHKPFTFDEALQAMCSDEDKMHYFKEWYNRFYNESPTSKRNGKIGSAIFTSILLLVFVPLITMMVDTTFFNGQNIAHFVVKPDCNYPSNWAGMVMKMNTVDSTYSVFAVKDIGTEFEKALCFKELKPTLEYNSIYRMTAFKDSCQAKGLMKQYFERDAPKSLTFK